MQHILNALQAGEVIAYPTDSLFAIGCDPWQKKAVVALCNIKRIEPAKANLSYLCADIGSASTLIKQIDKEVFKFINRNAPGPLTFVLEAGKEVPHHFRNKRKTIGIRIPDHYLIRLLLKDFGRPILTATLAEDLFQEGLDPSELVEQYKDLIYLWIDDESFQKPASTVIDCTVWPPSIIRDGGHEVIM